METSFDRWIAQRGTRLHIRDQVLAGAKDAREGKMTDVARSYLEHYRAEFIKHFDALEEGCPDGVFLAVEAAFHLGECMAAARFRKEVPFVQAGVAQRGRANKAALRKAPELAAVRAAMKRSKHAPAISEKYARLIEIDVAEEMGRSISISAIKRYVSQITKEEEEEINL